MFRQHHLTFTSEDGQTQGTYLTHRTVPTSGTTGKLLAEEVFSVIQEFNSIDSIQGILLDNTAVNTGSINGLVVQLEVLMGRKLHTQGCTLHQNELPLRALFKKLDNVTTGPNTFGGPLGQRCTGNILEEPVLRFKSIETPIIDGFLEDGVLKDLSVHQRLLFDYCKGIGSGNIENRWGTHKIGPLNHARWLTLAIRLLCLYE